MNANSGVVLDACVLANFGVCDLLLTLAETPRLYRPLWSREILEEVQRTQTGKLGWPEALVGRRASKDHIRAKDTGVASCHLSFEPR